MKKILLLLVLVIVFGNTAATFAVLGPIHVELNMIKPRLSAARANQITAFKIYIRYNVNIKIQNWLRFWFPIYESIQSDNPEEVIKQICDSLPPITGVREHPRFVPNEKYFKKYENSELKEYSTFYKILDYKGNIEFYKLPDLDNIKDWHDVCGGDTKNLRLVKDPSGLGCWMLGTIFPPMPYDEKERWKRIATIDRSSSLAYSPCTCQYPMIENSCKQTVFTFFTPLELEAWRKGYNSIDFNTSKTTGIIGPATPGRYRLAVATEPEPEPVESEAFVLPCSDVSDVEFLDNPNNNAETVLSVNFKVGEGGALDGGSSIVNIKFPPDIVAPDKFPARSIKFNGAVVNSSPKVEKSVDGTVIKIIVPTDVANFGQTSIEFSSSTNIRVIPSKKPISIEVSTTSEPNYISSKPVALGSTPLAVVTPDHEYKYSSIFCRAILPDGEILKAGSVISLNFSEGFKFPKTMEPGNVYVSGLRAKHIDIDGNSLKITIPANIQYYVQITINKNAGIRNPKAGTHSITLTTPSGSYGCGEFEIKPSVGLITLLELSDYQGSVESKYFFSLVAPSQTPLSVGDTFMVEFPQGTVLPKSFDIADITVNRKKTISAKADSTTLTIATPVEITSAKPVDVSIDIGIKNPRKHGSYTLKIIIGKAEPMVSEEFVLEPAPLKSWIYFKDSDKPNCGDWFNKPPILGFDCLNPEAKITFWFNSQPDKAVIYGGESRLNPGSMRTVITWQAEFNGVKEEPQGYDFNLDTMPPSIRVSKLNTGEMTNNKNYKIEGERGFTEMLTDGDNNKHQATDSVFVKFNGKETLLLEGQIYETRNSGSIKYKFDHVIQLNEGENIVEIIGRDQACNETVVKKKITLDTQPPKAEMVSPKNDEIFIDGDNVNVLIRTEASATVQINGMSAEIISSEDGVGVFSANISLVEGDNIVSIAVTDQSGNNRSLSYKIVAKPKKTIIVLTLDKKEWMVNGKVQTPLAVPPTATFKDSRYKDLNGSTYMPVAQLVPFFDSLVFWDVKEKKVTLEQKLRNNEKKIIELWLEKTKAKIDGKTVNIDPKGTLYPVSINGKTMLPLRFVAENLGASVVFDAKTKQITLTYPK